MSRGIAWAALMTIGVTAAADFDTVGIYTDLSDNPEMFAYLRACGYNTYEIVDGGFARAPEAREAFYRNVADQIARGREAGFRVYILILSNMEQITGPGEPKHLYGYFPPRDEALMRERLEYIRQAVRHLKSADGFIFFAGDPGGDPTKEADGGDCIAMGKRVRRIVKEEAPDAEFLFDPWAIAAWEKFPSPFTTEFWDKELALHKRVVADPELLRPDTGVEFPLHNYYRSLTLNCYADAGLKAEPYPTKSVIDDLRRRGVKRLWAWPYFLIDECDDGYSGHTWGQTQAETRYLHRIVSVGREIGLNGVIGNVSMKGLHPEVLNLYAFGRFCADTAATPDGVLREFAAVLVEPDGVDALTQVLAFIENHSTWEAGTPERDRLPKLACNLAHAGEAQARLSQVKPKADASFPLPEKPAAYLERLRDRLRIIAEKP